MFDEIETFLNQYCEGKSDFTRRQVNALFRSWKEYYKADLPSSLDIDMFIDNLSRKPLKPRTIIAYLFHLAKFFEAVDREDLKLQIASHAQKMRENQRKELKDNPPDAVSYKIYLNFSQLSNS